MENQVQSFSEQRRKKNIILGASLFGFSVLVALSVLL